MFYSKTTKGFYDPTIHGANIPPDAVEITDQQHADLLSGQAAGKVITADANGNPELTDPPALTHDQLLRRAQDERAAAYRAEADPLFFKAQRQEATMADWNAKIAEIRARFPDPA